MKYIGAIVAIIIIFGVILLGPIGYISNIVKLVRLDFNQPYKAEVIRSLGVVVAPLGVITGFIHIEDN